MNTERCPRVMVERAIRGGFGPALLWSSETTAGRYCWPDAYGDDGAPAVALIVAPDGAVSCAMDDRVIYTGALERDRAEAWERIEPAIQRAQSR